MNAIYKVLTFTLILLLSFHIEAQPITLNKLDDSLSKPMPLNYSVDTLKNTVKGYPVLGVFNDTLFLVYTKIGSFSTSDRAFNISKRIQKLYNDDMLQIDSISIAQSELTLDIVYGEITIMSISEVDAKWTQMPIQDLAKEYSTKIKNDLIHAKEETSLQSVIIKISKILGVILIVWLFIWLIGKLNKRLLNLLDQKKNKWLKNLSHKDYTFLSAEQELTALLFLIKIIRWLLILLILYLTFPVVFNILVFTRTWSHVLFNWFWMPFKAIFISIWDYLPNLFSILAIYIVMKFFIRIVKYIFNEIEMEKLKINGFHSDWAQPTFTIIRFILYAFMFVLIFPYLPGSDSNIFKGVSVFIGVLFSLGSSSAIANIVAGIVITYMRPFKIGDRIKIGDVIGDVVEKTLLVTRLTTIKNEEITIPNSTILTGNISNYSSHAKGKGLIIHTTVTIGYDVPWKDMHQALIDAALRTEFILKKPEPFVLQTSLDDFYVSYQINAYTHEARKQALIYSNLHQNIQDVCNERGIEILSPHYRYQRDGNTTTIPTKYLPDDYQSPGFNVNIKNKPEK